MKSALDVHRELLAAGVAHEMVRVRGGIVTADDLPVGLGADPGGCVAVRCYVASYDGDSARSEQFVAVLVRSGDTPDPRCLLDALQAVAIRPATAAEINVATDYAAPLVCPIGLGSDVVLLADAALGSTDVLYAATGEGGVALGIHTRDLLVTAGARVTALTAGPLSPAEVSAGAGWDHWDHSAGLGLPVTRAVEVAPVRGLKNRPRDAVPGRAAGASR